MAKPKTVPGRTPIKKVQLSRNSRALELEGREPGFHYEYFSTEKGHPSYIGNKLTRHEIGNQASGYAVVEPWEVVQDATASKVAPLDPRTDQGKSVDTTRRKGTQVLCRIPIAEHAKYNAVHDGYCDVMERQLYATSRQREENVAVTETTSESGADWQTALKNAGHPMPQQPGA